MDELLQAFRQIAKAEAGSGRKHAFGHIASYDPNTHHVRVLLPSLRDASGNMLLTPWIPLGSCWVGRASDGITTMGFQFIPFGGATSDNPGKGEQCLVEIVESGGGRELSAVATLYFTDAMPPIALTANSSFTPALGPGDAVFRLANGSLIIFRANGSIQIGSAGSVQPAARQTDQVTIPGGLGSNLQTILDGRYQLKTSPANTSDLTGSITGGSGSVKIGG